MNEVQASDALVGAWRLVSWANRAVDGQVTYPMGADARGYLLYTADGRFSVLISRAGRVCRRRPAWRDERGEGPGPGGLRGLWGPVHLPWRPGRASRGAIAVPQLGRYRA